jgi:hypothetical protein
MNSQSTLLLQKQLKGEKKSISFFKWQKIVLFSNVFDLKKKKELNKNPVNGFSAGLIDDNDIYKWEVRRK